MLTVNPDTLASLDTEHGFAWKLEKVSFLCLKLAQHSIEPLYAAISHENLPLVQMRGADAPALIEALSLLPSEIIRINNGTIIHNITHAFGCRITWVDLP